MRFSAKLGIKAGLPTQPRNQSPPLRLNLPPISHQTRRLRLQKQLSSLLVSLHLPLEERNGRLAELSPVRSAVRRHVPDGKVRLDRRDLGGKILVVTLALR